MFNNIRVFRIVRHSKIDGGQKYVRIKQRKLGTRSY